MENNVIEKGKKKNLIIGIMACLIILLIAALVYFIFIKKDKKEELVKPQESEKIENNNGNDNNNDNENNNDNDNNNDGIYKTIDGKFTFKIVAHTDGEAYLNNEKFNYTNVESDEKYAFYSGDFDGEVREDYYHFLIDKEKNIIVEKDFETVSKLNDKKLRFYGDGDISKYNTFVKCNAGYFFVSYLGGPFDEGEEEIVNVYTTNWKELGYIDLNNIKSDKAGIFVYKNYDEDYKLSGTAIKYDENGNQIN